MFHFSPYQLWSSSSNLHSEFHLGHNSNSIVRHKLFRWLWGTWSDNLLKTPPKINVTNLLNCVPGELYIVMVQSIPSPSKMLMRGASLFLFLAHAGLAGGINRPEQKSPAGTMKVLGVWSQLSYWPHRKVCAGRERMGGGRGRLLHPSATWVKGCRYQKRGI